MERGGGHKGGRRRSWNRSGFREARAGFVGPRCAARRAERAPVARSSCVGREAVSGKRSGRRNDSSGATLGPNLSPAVPPRPLSQPVMRYISRVTCQLSHWKANDGSSQSTYGLASLGPAAIAGLALCSSEGQTSSRLIRRSGGHADVPGERQGRDPRSDFSERFEFGADSEARADAHSLVPVPPSRRAPFDVVALASSAGD